MKSIIIALATVFATASPANAMTFKDNLVNLNVSYAQEILYCDSNLSMYSSAVFFDNNGSCIDPTDVILNGDLNEWMAQNYPGGSNQWSVLSDSGKECNFQIIQLHPTNEVLVWDTFITACSVRLKETVNENWIMYDKVDPSKSFKKCEDGMVGVWDNCLDSEDKLYGQHMSPSSLSVINEASIRLQKRFYADYKVWHTKNKNKISVTISKSPAGSKTYLQKWVDFKWVTVYVEERLWEPKSTFTYKAKKGTYRIYSKSISGKSWKSKNIRV